VDELMSGLIQTIALARDISPAEAERWLAECLQRHGANVAKRTEVNQWETDAECWLDGQRLLFS